MRRTVFERSLFNVWRLVAILFLAFAASLLDMYLLHVIGVETVSEVVSQTVIHATGAYIGFTVAAYFV